jgi:lia operon protein LiaF
MRTSSWMGLILVAGGVLYLLSEFHLLHFTAGVWTFHALWPLLLVAIGLGSALHRGRIRLSSLVIALFGVFLFLHNSGLSPVFASTSVTSVFWATLLIFIGLQVFFPTSSRRKRRTISVHVDGKRHDIAWKDAVGDWRGWKAPRVANRHWIGDVSLGSQPWVLDDLDIWHGIGDVRINLATAHLEDKTYDIRIEGWIGDVRILVPASLPIAANVEMNIGDVNVFEHAESGTGRSVHYRDEAYDTASRRIKLNIQLKIGEVKIVRV